MHVEPGWTVSAWAGIPGRDGTGVMVTTPRAWEITLALRWPPGRWRRDRQYLTAGTSSPRARPDHHGPGVQVTTEPS